MKNFYEYNGQMVSEDMLSELQNSNSKVIEVENEETETEEVEVENTENEEISENEVVIEKPKTKKKTTKNNFGEKGKIPLTPFVKGV